MIEKINKINLIDSFSNSTELKEKIIIAVELKKIISPEYIISKTKKIGKVYYINNNDLDDKMIKLSVEISQDLNLNYTRILNYHNDSIINIELEGKETKFIGEYGLHFYGFYELNQEEVFILAFEDELIRNIKYLIYKNIKFINKFPYDSLPNDEYIN